MGPHIFQTCPSANYFDCKAMSIGARSQSARTYLERHMDTFLDCESRVPTFIEFTFLQLRPTSSIFLKQSRYKLLTDSIENCGVYVYVYTTACYLYLLPLGSAWHHPLGIAEIGSWLQNLLLSSHPLDSTGAITIICFANEHPDQLFGVGFCLLKQAISNW